MAAAQVGHAPLWHLGAEALAVLALTTALKVTRGRRKHMYPYSGPSTAQVAEVWECLGCGSTNCCKQHELAGDGWVTHRLEDDTYVVVCPECVDTFDERRRIRAAMAW